MSHTFLYFSIWSGYTVDWVTLIYSYWPRVGFVITPALCQAVVSYTYLRKSRILFRRTTRAFTTPDILQIFTRESIFRAQYRRNFLSVLLPFARLVRTGALRVVVTNSESIVWVGVLVVSLLGIDDRRTILRLETFADFFAFISIRATIGRLV